MFAPETEKLVEQLIQTEYKNACKNYGDKYHSLHEAYAILLEEVEESEKEFARIKAEVSFLWSNIKNCEGQDIKFYLDVLPKHTQNAMKELAQVGAVLLKIRNTINEVKQ